MREKESAAARYIPETYSDALLGTSKCAASATLDEVRKIVKKMAATAIGAM